MGKGSSKSAETTVPETPGKEHGKLKLKKHPEFSLKLNKRDGTYSIKVGASICKSLFVMYMMGRGIGVLMYTYTYNIHILQIDQNESNSGWGGVWHVPRVFGELGDDCCKELGRYLRPRVFLIV